MKKQGINRKFIIGSRFHVTLLIVSPYICQQCWQVKRWKAKTRSEKVSNLKTLVKKTHNTNCDK